MSKLWDKGLALNQQIEAFTVGNDYLLDQSLVYYDCIASKAHASVLEKAALLSPDEAQQIKQGLDDIIALQIKGEFEITSEQEDCHTAIEAYLIETLGELGKKIHTARSRNDQVLTAQRLYYRDQLKEVESLRVKLIETMAQFVERFGQISYPGYTHMQKAMPSSFAMWGWAFIESMEDNGMLLATVSKILDQSPLGTAAGYGVPLEIDREMAAQELGFARVQQNPIYAQNSRGKFDALLIHSLSAMTADFNKIASDLILFNMSEFKFVKLPDEFCTGSSIMPQKKNPDVLELMRAKHHLVKACEFEVSSLTGNLISGYNRDLQLTKEPVMKALKITQDCLEIAVLLFQNLEVNEDRCQKAMSPELYATERAYDLVRQGVPFRDAYIQIAHSLEEDS
ncbi:MAG: argininosuccinate lyase [Candidatus Marinimicrobia bacterium]|nr:argininosuccinate lyase [Candidatus Neomarinimicrobiota bacterium]